MTILTKNQQTLLAKIGLEPSIRDNFYLTGGTALAAFYLQHRYSEDLDFFSETEFEPQGIRVVFEKIKSETGIIQLDFKQNLNRNLFFLHWPNEVLKTEFTFFPFPRIEIGRPELGMTIDSLLDIAVNKLFTIYQRSQARDYIDLYVICQRHKLTVDDLIKKAKIKFDWHIDPLQLGVQFVKAGEVKDYPRMITALEDKDWQNFFLTEAQKLKDQIIES